MSERVGIRLVRILAMERKKTNKGLGKNKDKHNQKQKATPPPSLPSQNKSNRPIIIQ